MAPRRPAAARRRTGPTRRENRASTAHGRAITGQRRIEHFAHFGLRRAATWRCRSALACVPLQPHAKRAQAAQPEEAIVGRCGDAHVGPQAMQRRKRVVVRDDRAEQHVRMAADVFGRRMHRHVDAVVERAKAKRRRPRVVEHDPRAALVRGVGDRAACPAPRTSAIPAIRRTPASCSDETRRRCRAGQRIVVARRRCRGAAGGCRRIGASDRRRRRSRAA